MSDPNSPHKTRKAPPADLALSEAIPRDQGEGWMETLLTQYQGGPYGRERKQVGLAATNREAVFALLRTLQQPDGGVQLFETLRNHGPDDTAAMLMGVLAVHARSSRSDSDKPEENSSTPAKADDAKSLTQSDLTRDILMKDVQLVRRAMAVLKDVLDDANGLGLGFDKVLHRLASLERTQSLQDVLMLQTEVRDLLLKIKHSHDDGAFPEALDGGPTMEAAEPIADLLKRMALRIGREAQSYEFELASENQVTALRSASLRPILDAMPPLEPELEALLASERDELRAANLIGHRFSENIEQRSAELLTAARHLAGVIGRELFTLSQAFEIYHSKLKGVAKHIAEIAESDSSVEAKCSELLLLSNMPQLGEDVEGYDQLDEIHRHTVKRSLQRITTALIEIRWLQNAAEDVKPGKTD